MYFFNLMIDFSWECGDTLVQYVYIPSLVLKEASLKGEPYQFDSTRDPSIQTKKS